MPVSCAASLPDLFTRYHPPRPPKIDPRSRATPGSPEVEGVDLRRDPTSTPPRSIFSGIFWVKTSHLNQPPRPAVQAGHPLTTLLGSLEPDLWEGRTRWKTAAIRQMPAHILSAVETARAFINASDQPSSCQSLVTLRYAP